ncbi:MAG: CDP-alcohol phosphatidyltransferase family protein [Deltaproteobacteria bacterium]|nr:CDP-alcohol phosphatidyltransferase family protein [Deltaproteobacteria bacterium]MBW2207654.1 CDP-alcohol phosphatidyltransferase family protein [Deltaproteobacteria bacterium]
MAKITFISEKNRERYMKILSPVGNFLARVGVHPHILTVTGVVLSALAGLVYCNGSFFWAAWVLVLAGSCDALDGQIARQTDKKSQFGAFMDSTLDRYSDMFPLLGLAYYFAGGPAFYGSASGTQGGDCAYWTVIITVLAITGSFMVSYTRARAEALGMSCKKGLMQRPERITLLIIGSLLGAIPGIGTLLMKATLIVLALSTNVTAVHRMVYVKQQLLRENQPK